MRDVLPPGLLGLMLTGVLAALASMVDPQLNWGAAYWTNDVYSRFLCGSPPPTWFPWREAWISGLLIIGGPLLSLVGFLSDSFDQVAIFTKHW